MSRKKMVQPWPDQPYQFQSHVIMLHCITNNNFKPGSFVLRPPSEVQIHSHYSWPLLPYFFDQTLRLLFEDGVYFVVKLADSNSDWNKYMRAIQLGMIDTGSSTCSLSVLLSAVEMSLRTWTGLEIAQWASVAIISTHVRVPCILATATILGRHLCSQLCGYYSRVTSNWRTMVIAFPEKLDQCSIQKPIPHHCYAVLLCRCIT